MGIVIEGKAQVCDHNITLSVDATFKQHFNALRSKVGWILLMFKTRGQLPFLTLLKQLVLCEDECCCQICSPTRAGEIQTLEAVQRAFVQRISSTQDLSHWQQLEELKLNSMEHFRKLFIIIYAWQILKSQVPNLECTSVLLWCYQRSERECRVLCVSSFVSPAVEQTHFSSIAI